MDGSLLHSVAVSVAFLAIAGGILSGLLVIAELKILDYGVCPIDINNGEKTLAVKGGASLLGRLGENQIFIPSACGGRGSCAYCKVTVLAGGGPIGPVEEPYLSPKERAANVRLACQVKVRGPVSIVIPRELFLVRRFRGTLVHKRPLTSDIVELRIKLVLPAAMDFVAGQYVQLESPAYKGREPVMRAYSISSRQAENDHLELIIRKVPGGICTTWVFDHLRQGATVNLSGPYGEFRLSHSGAPMICIAGGSGMAPFWGMFRTLRDQGITREVTYFFGARTQNDLFLADELRALEKELPGFRFIPALSNEPDGSGWQGERGLITQAVTKYFPDASRHEGYLCGAPGMIDASVKALTAAGMPKDKVYYDKFA